jgi:ParB family chromosome partitioning protein
VETIRLDLIFANPNQPRRFFDPVALDELAASIRERGVLEPIVVRPKDGRYEIVAGERRYRASQLAGLEEIPVVIRELSDEEAMTDSLLENFQREDLTVIEKARAVQSLLGVMPAEQAARSLGCSTSTLRRYLDLLDLPEAIQNELTLPPNKQATSGFTEGHARLLRALNSDPRTQQRMVEKVKREKLSVDQTERLLEAFERAPEKQEAFLRISLDAVEEIMKRSGQRLERKRAFKKRTAQEFLQSLQKATSELSPLLDEEVTRFLSNEQMNQLLAICTGVQEELDAFTRKVRKDLLSDDFGFMETYVFCNVCGRRELIGSLKCSVCGSVLKRCSDCGYYDVTYQQCSLHGFYVYASEAEAPDERAQSYQCESYKSRVEMKK